MAANTLPIYTRVINNDWGTVIAANANTALDGTGTVTTVWTAGSEGGMVNCIKVKSGSTTATSAAGILRIWINNGSANSTPANNTLVMEQLLTANTASATANTINYCFPLNIGMEAGHKILVTVSTMAASSIWAVTCEGGDY